MCLSLWTLGWKLAVVALVHVVTSSTDRAGVPHARKSWSSEHEFALAASVCLRVDEAEDDGMSGPNLLGTGGLGNSK